MTMRETNSPTKVANFARFDPKNHSGSENYGTRSRHIDARETYEKFAVKISVSERRHIEYAGQLPVGARDDLREAHRLWQEVLAAWDMNNP
ncbi:MAG: hypothetical protein JWO50_336 [Candidatus Kaiserbacteria bacterium]|nr:hypothetical protein [Candidatus Kaiserbacteria bacterium]